MCSKTGAILSITWNRDGEGVRDPLSPGSAKRRKFTVEYLFSEVFGSPKEPEWAAPNFHLRLSLSRIIMDMLDVPSNSKEAVITAMRAMSKAHEAGVEYDPSGEIKAWRGAKVLIEDYTPQADVVYRTMESGMSFGQGTPKEVWHLMTETWTVVGTPSNARITEDISGWERVCDKIIEAKGTIVLDENFRTGRRAGRCTERVTERQSPASATARARTCLSSLCTPR